MYTITEVENQFFTWLKIDGLLEQNKILIKEIHDQIDDDTMVVFTGAGTSGYIGDFITSYLNAEKTKEQFVSYYSTAIVGNPNLLLGNKKIVLVSFGRSGNSPESCEVIRLAEQYANSCIHLIITCNKKGNLALRYPEYSIVLPDETNDNGFAMTNSFSTMMLTAAKIFGLQIDLSKVVEISQKVYEDFDYEIVLKQDLENIIFLSNTENLGLLNELKLKFMELTNGRYGYYSDQMLNFRHGPKSVITRKSIIVLLCSTEEIAMKYDADIIDELYNDKNNPYVICFGEHSSKSSMTIPIELEGFERAVSIIPVCQRLAVEKSIEQGINPDNPSPSGSVNRVVQGVTIHERKTC